MPRKSNTLIDISKLTYTQLAALETRILDLKKTRRTEEQEALRLKLRDMAEKHGFALDTLIAARKTYPVPVKYKDPRNPKNTWSGRGRPARWLAAYEKAGHKRDEYRVD